MTNAKNPTFDHDSAAHGTDAGELDWGRVHAVTVSPNPKDYGGYTATARTREGTYHASAGDTLVEAIADAVANARREANDATN